MGHNPGGCPLYTRLRPTPHNGWTGVRWACDNPESTVFLFCTIPNLGRLQLALFRMNECPIRVHRSRVCASMGTQWYMTRMPTLNIITIQVFYITSLWHSANWNLAHITDCRTKTLLAHRALYHTQRTQATPNLIRRVIYRLWNILPGRC